MTAPRTCLTHGNAVEECMREGCTGHGHAAAVQYLIEAQRLARVAGSKALSVEELAEFGSRLVERLAALPHFPGEWE